MYSYGRVSCSHPWPVNFRTGLAKVSGLLVLPLNCSRWENRPFLYGSCFDKKTTPREKREQPMKSLGFIRGLVSPRQGCHYVWPPFLNPGTASRQSIKKKDDAKTERSFDPHPCFFRERNKKNNCSRCRNRHWLEPERPCLRFVRRTWVLKCAARLDSQT